MLIATDRKEEGAGKVEIHFWKHPRPEWTIIRSAEVAPGTQFSVLYGDYPDPRLIAGTPRDNVLKIFSVGVASKAERFGMVKELDPELLLANFRGPVPLDLTMDAPHEILPRVQFRLQEIAKRAPPPPDRPALPRDLPP